MSGRARTPALRLHPSGLAVAVLLASCARLPGRDDGENRFPPAGPGSPAVAAQHGKRPVPRGPLSARDLGAGTVVELTLAPPPSFARTTRILVRRRDDGFPTGRDDEGATLVYRGPFLEKLFDSGVVLHHDYFYATYADDPAPASAEGWAVRVHVGVPPVTDLRVADPGLGNRLVLSWRDAETEAADFVRILRFPGACDPDPESAGFERRVDLAVDVPGRLRTWTDDGVPDCAEVCYAVFVRAGAHYSPGSSASGRSTDATPPQAVTGLSAGPVVVPGDVGVDLLWNNPPDADLERVLVLARSGEVPRSPDDPLARVVCDGKVESCRDRQVEDGATVRYRVWALDELGLASVPASAAAKRPYVDDDGDTLREDQGDCDDRDARIHPGAASLDCSATDWDCDGTAWDDSFCTSSAPAWLDEQCARRLSSYPCLEGSGCAWYARPDHSPCRVVTEPDASYDICVGGACRSPGTCGSAECNSPGPHYRLPPAVGHAAFDRTRGREPVVTDRVTGLVWQGCPAGLAGGDCAFGSARGETYAEALALCDGLAWGGFDDWRLPDPLELLTLVDYGRGAPAIAAEAFPATSEFFWSSSSYASGSSVAWVVHFAAGHQSYSGWEQRHHVRCVRSPPAVGDGPETGWKRFRRRDGPPDRPVVDDTVTGLTWQGCAAGQSGPDCATGDATVDTWDRAVAFCEALEWGGFADWRLPDVKELAGIADTRVRSPCIDAAAFPATAIGWYWSSLPWVLDPSSAWQVNFSSGHVGTSDKTFRGNFRCVRGGF